MLVGHDDDDIGRPAGRNIPIAPRAEATCAHLRLNKLLQICYDCRELKTIHDVASGCLTIDFTKRPTAEELLKLLNPPDREP